MANREKKIEKYYSMNRRFLKNILRNLVEWEGLPESIDERALNDYVLFGGFAAGFQYNGEVIVAEGALSGIDHYYRPTWYTCSNAKIMPVQRRRVGVGCCICYNTPNYQFPESFQKLVDLYAWRLADISLSEEISIRNSKAALVPLVKDEKEAIRFNSLMEKVYDGDSFAIGYKLPIGRSVDDMFLPLRARENLVVDLLADARRSTLADFFSMLGVKTIAVDKKERTNLLEMSSDGQQRKITSDIIMKPRQRWCKEMNDRFGTNISVKFNEEEVDKYELQTLLEGRTVSGSDRNINA